MPLLSTSDFPPPTDDKEFEEMVRDLFAAHWHDPDTKVYGRSGQSQNGVDIYGRPNQGHDWFGIQCKLRKAGKLTRRNLEDEIKMARTFHYKLHTYVFVTTLLRDTELQKIVGDLSDIERNRGGFEVQIRFWEDVCSLLSDNFNIARKYYPQYFKGWAFSENVAGQPLSTHPTKITVDSPMLVGVLIDVSRSMIQLLRESQGFFGETDLRKAISVVVEKAAAFCRTPESNRVLPKFALFVYGYGWGDLRKGIDRILNRLLGENEQTESAKFIPAGPVRDFFAEVAIRKSLPFTPSILTLSDSWEEYRKSVDYQFIDMGSGPSNMYEGLCLAYERFLKELERPYYEYPLLIVISDGQVADGSLDDVARITQSIKQLDVQVVNCYLSGDDVTLPKTFYADIQPHWSPEIAQLFSNASMIEGSNALLENVAREARQGGWQVPAQARLFLQINHSEMLKELVEILLSSLKD